ncbi:MAG: hypothetical protein ACKO96_39625 [Flammeovirgaceae bacterium]
MLVNQVDKNKGMNPLMSYLRNQSPNIDIIRLLINYGTMLTHYSKQGHSALQIYIIGSSSMH